MWPGQHSTSACASIHTQSLVHESHVQISLTAAEKKYNVFEANAQDIDDHHRHYHGNGVADDDETKHYVVAGDESNDEQEYDDDCC